VHVVYFIVHVLEIVTEIHQQINLYKIYKQTDRHGMMTLLVTYCYTVVIGYVLQPYAAAAAGTVGGFTALPASRLTALPTLQAAAAAASPGYISDIYHQHLHDMSSCFLHLVALCRRREVDLAGVKWQTTLCGDAILSFEQLYTRSVGRPMCTKSLLHFGTWD